MNNNYCVPVMTPDLYYGFEGPEIDRQMRHPSKPVRDHIFRSDYSIRAGCLEISNGPNLFNRPLYAPGCRTFATAGDRPAVILWNNNQYKKCDGPSFGMPDGLGHFFSGLSVSGASKWFHEFDTCNTLYHPGWIEYRMSDDAFSGIEVAFELVPHSSGAFLIHVEVILKKAGATETTDTTDTTDAINATNTTNTTNTTDAAVTAGTGDDTAQPEIIWTHGCLNYDTHNCWMDSYDPQSRAIPWDEPLLASNDIVLFTDGFTVLKDSHDTANWVSVASIPAPSLLFSTDAKVRLDISPGDIFNHPQKGHPSAAGRIRTTVKDCMTYACSIVLNWGRNSDPFEENRLLIENFNECLAEGKKYFECRCGRISIKTPDPELDAVFRFNAVAADSMWHPPGINHGPYSWGGLTTVFRIYYGLTCCGDHERIASALDFHCGTDENGALLNLAGSPEEKPMASGYESYGSTADMLWHHYLWTGDRAVLEKWAPVVDRLLEYEEKGRKDSRGLFIDCLGFWCSDSSNYEEGCAVGTVYVWRMYKIRAEMARVLGQDPVPFLKRADEIKALLYKHLWSEENGFFFDSVSTDGDLAPSPIAPAIYHPIEYGMVDETKAHRMLDWMMERLVSPAGVVRVDDWFPINWSHNVYSPLETANTAIAAYKTGRAEEGYRLLKGVAGGALYKAIVPGSISCHASSTGITKNGTDFGDGVSLFLRAVIEGLFGVGLNVPEKTVYFSPGFPEEWQQAEMTIPDISILKYSRTREDRLIRLQYRICPGIPMKISASIPVNGKIRGVYAGGSPVEYVVEKKAGGLFICFTSCICDGLDITVEYEQLHPNILPACESDGLGIIAQYEPEAAETGTTHAAVMRKSDCESIVREHNYKETVEKHFHKAAAGEYDYEMIDLDGLATIPFQEVYKLYPGELIWNLLYEKDRAWTCRYDRRFEGKSVHMLNTAGGVPFRFDKDRVIPVKYKHDNKLWQGVDLDLDIPGSVTVNVGRPADTVFLLLSGICTPMTCYLPQVQISLIYEGAGAVEYQLDSPYRFDFISQHTSVHPAEAIGWFGNAGDLDKGFLDQKEILEPVLSINKQIQQLHADMIALEGTGGILDRIEIKMLKRHSGIVLYGVTTGISKK